MPRSGLRGRWWEKQTCKCPERCWETFCSSHEGASPYLISMWEPPLTLWRTWQCLKTSRNIAVVFMHYLQFVQLLLVGRLFLAQYNQKGSLSIMGLVQVSIAVGNEEEQGGYAHQCEFLQTSWACKLLSIYYPEHQTAYLFQVQLNYSDQSSNSIDI